MVKFKQKVKRNNENPVKFRKFTNSLPDHMEGSFLEAILFQKERTHLPKRKFGIAPQFLNFLNFMKQDGVLNCEKAAFAKNRSEASKQIKKIVCLKDIQSFDRKYY